jgi:preprotein translocase subunit SecG
MYQLILIIHVFAALCIIALVLVQQGKGATVGAAFGSGASQTVFGSRGSGSFLLKITIGFVVLFFATSIALNYLASRVVKQAQQVELPVPVEQQHTTVPPVSPSSIPTPGSAGKASGSR